MTVHIVCSYGIAHQWSHQAALEHTANDTKSVIGIAVPQGVYVNFLFLIIYIGNAIWRFRVGDSLRRKPKWLGLAIDWFLHGIVLMATVVFETGWIRWAVVGFLVAMLVRYWVNPTKGVDPQ